MKATGNKLFLWFKGIRFHPRLAAKHNGVAHGFILHCFRDPLRPRSVFYKGDLKMLEMPELRYLLRRAAYRKGNQVKGGVCCRKQGCEVGCYHGNRKVATTE